MKRDLQKKGYFYDPERFAELIERGRREGIEQVVKALIETSSELGSTKEETID